MPTEADHPSTALLDQGRIRLAADLPLRVRSKSVAASRCFESGDLILHFGLGDMRERLSPPSIPVNGPHFMTKMLWGPGPSALAVGSGSALHSLSQDLGDIAGRLVRLLRPEATNRWLTSPIAALGDESPLDAILGGRVKEVRELISRLEATIAS